MAFTSFGGSLLKSPTKRILFTIGSRAGSRPFNGTIDEVRIWNRSLTADEVKARYLGENKYYLTGQLRDKSNNPVQANILLYNPGTSNINATNQTTGDGSYTLYILPSMYDIQYTISNFFISNFWIKLPSFNITADFKDLVNYITGYPSQNKLSFTVNVNSAQVIQTYSDKKPNKVSANGTQMTEVASLSALKDGTWYYDSDGKKLYINYIYAPSIQLGGYTSSWNFREYDAETIAKTFDMSQSWYTYNWDPGWDYSAKMNQVHALNQNYKFLMYRNCISVPDYLTDEWNYAQSQGWLLKDINGNYVTEGWTDLYGVDITNPAYQQWLAAKVKSLLDLQPFDGVYVDNGLKYNAAIFDALFTTRPINPRTGTYFTDQEIRDGMAGMLNAIIDAIGTSKLLMPNGIWNGAAWWNNPSADGYRYILSKVPRLNCLGSEGTFRAYDGQWYSESNWKQSVDFVVWVQDNFLNGHSDRYFDAACTSVTLPPGATVEQVIKYGYCSMLLGTKFSSPQNTIEFGFSESNLPNATLLQLLQKIRSIDVGYPINDYYTIEGTHVYARDFSNAKVLVNPTDSSYSVSLGSSYKTLDGLTVSSVTMTSHTGAILLKA
jgi:hypothetical protein